MKKFKKLKGFTLVELIIVIAIAAILIAVAIPQFSKAKLSAEVSAHNSNVQTIKSAAIMASMDGNVTNDNIREKTKGYLEGGEFPKIPTTIYKEAFTNEPTGNNTVDAWEVEEVNGEIKVTPGLYKIENGEVVKDTTKNPVKDTTKNPVEDTTKNPVEDTTKSE